MMDPPRLSVLCATQGDPCVWPLLREMVAMAARCHAGIIFVADGPASVDRLHESGALPDAIFCAEQGVHQTMAQVVSGVASAYVCILDDDERVTKPLEQWLTTEGYQAAALWWVARAWLWQTPAQYLSVAPHWHDWQLRIGRRDLVTIPTRVHGGWIGQVVKPARAPYAIEHHKCLLRSKAERIDTIARYEQLQAGAGVRFYDMYVPEERGVTTARWHEGMGI